jgi:hypothetical protein
MLPNADPVAPPRRHACDITDAVVANMRKNLERLKYSTLAPSRYTVYLHPAEFGRLEGIMPVLREQTVRALAEELQRLNAASPIRRLMRRVVAEREPQIRNAAAEWQVDFLADPDGDLGEGDLLVDSELVLPTPIDLGPGERTRRNITRHCGEHATTRAQTVSRHTSSPASVQARIDYDDDAGHHVYEIGRDSVTIGRGGVAFPVDIRIASSPDVSREHARIRRDRATDRFYLIDLSSLGTTLNGRHVPKGYDEAGGTKRENGLDTLLPDVARIGLADTVFLEFRRQR